MTTTASRPIRPPGRLRALLSVALLAATGGAIATSAPASAAPAATTYHVDCSLKTGGDGVRLPFRSLAAVNAHAAFLPGDQILLKRGTTCKGQLHPKGSGASGAPIVLGAYPSKGAKPTVAGGGTANNTGAVQLTDQHHWIVQDLHVTNGTKSVNPTTHRSGVLLKNSGVGRLAGLTIRRLSIDHVYSNPANGRTSGGISVITLGHVKSGFDHVSILDNRIEKSGRTGIAVENRQHFTSYDSHLRIAGNTVSHVRGDGIIVVGVEDARVDHNVVAYAAQLAPCPKCGKSGPATASAGIWPAVARRVRIDHNEVYGTNRAYGDGQGIDVDLSAHDIAVEQNYLHDNQGGGVLFCGAQRTTVRFNLLQNNGRAAFTFTCKPKVKTVWIYNNTVYAKRSVVANYIVRTYDGFGAKDVRFFNNIVYSYGVGKYQWPATKVLNKANTYVGLHHRTVPKGAGSSWRDPHLTRPGTGGHGFGAAKAYRPTTRTPKGVAVPASAKADLRSGSVSRTKPYRGAVQHR